MSEPEQQSELTPSTPAPRRAKPKYRGGAGADHVRPAKAEAPEKHNANDSVYYVIKDHYSVALKIGTERPEQKSRDGSLTYPVKTIGGGEFKPVEGEVGWVHEADLQSKEKYEDEQRKKSGQTGSAGQQPAGSAGQQAQGSSQGQGRGQGRLGQPDLHMTRLRFWKKKW
ncbi:hypothetical protein MBLNU13_g09591t2 [Cladosporium sp. NU13]